MIKIKLIYFSLALCSIATAQEINPCKQRCQFEKTECRSEARKNAITDANPPIRNGSMQLLDKNADMHSILEERQRQEDGTRRLLFDRYDGCDRGYVQCISACGTESVFKKQ